MPAAAVRPILDCPQLRARAEALAAEFDLTFLEPTAPSDERPQLQVTLEGLQLSSGAHLPPLRLDFCSGAMRHRLRTQSKRQPLVRALGLDKHPHKFHVVDAGAGLGRDLLTIAGYAGKVTALERHPLIFAILRDGLERAAASPELRDLCRRITLLHGDTATWLEGPEATGIDAVHFDPMYPEKKKAALAKKELQVLQHLLSPDPQESVPLQLALQIAPRCAVKRPPQAPPLLPGAQYSLRSKQVRYDVYLRAAKSP